MKKQIIEKIKKNPLAKILIVKIKNYYIKKSAFKNSKDYWITRYSRGGNSGVGSYDKFAEFKADVINYFVKDKKIERVIEFGCGDGNQLKYFGFKEYIGFDISHKALDICKNIFKNDNSKSFILLKNFQNQKGDLTISLDVIYHLIEDEVFNEYMNRLFFSSLKYVIIYASNSTDYNSEKIPHVKHRKFSDWIEVHHPEFVLIKQIQNKYPYNGDYLKSSFSDFFIYEKKQN